MKCILWAYKHRFNWFGLNALTNKVQPMSNLHHDNREGVKPKTYFNSVHKAYKFSTVKSTFQQKNESQPTEYEKREISLIQTKFAQFITELNKALAQDSTDGDRLIQMAERYINEQIFSFYSTHQKHLQNYQTTPTNFSSQQQGFITNPHLIKHYSFALSIKSSLSYRFRKFDSILTDLQNEIYLLCFMNIENKIHAKVDALCGKYLEVLVLHDHNRLREILMGDYSGKGWESEEKKGDGDVTEENMRRKGRKVTRKAYQAPTQFEQFGEEQQEQRTKSTKTLSKAFRIFMKSENPQSQLTKAMAFAVIGQFQKSIKILLGLINQDNTNKEYWGAFMSIYVYYANENYYDALDSSKGKEGQYSSTDLRQFIKSTLSKCTSDRPDPPLTITPEDSEYLLDSILSFLCDTPLSWSDCTIQQLSPFCYSIYLIAENYYLSGRKSKAMGMVEELKRKVENRERIRMVEWGREEIGRRGRRLAAGKGEGKGKEEGKGDGVGAGSTKGNGVLSPSQKGDFFQSQQYMQINSDIGSLIQFFQLMQLYDSQQFPTITSTIQPLYTLQQQSTFYTSYSVRHDTLRSNIYQIFQQAFTKLSNKQKADQYCSLKIANYCVNDTYQINEIEQAIPEEEVGGFQFLREKKQKMKGRRKGVPPYYLGMRSGFVRGEGVGMG